MRRCFVLVRLVSVSALTITALVVMGQSPAHAAVKQDWFSDVFAIHTDEGGRPTIHSLDAQNSFATFNMHAWVSAVGGPTSGAQWEHLVADYNGDGYADLYLVNRNMAGKTVVSIVNGATNYSTFLVHAQTALHATDASTWEMQVGDYDLDGRGDLFAIERNDGGRTAVHVMPAATNFSTFLIQVKSGMHSTADPAWDVRVGNYDEDGRSDLIVINKNDAGKTAVHVLSSMSRYQDFVLHSVSGIHATTAAQWELQIGDFEGDGYADLYAIDKDDQGKTAVHVLSGASDYKQFEAQSLTPMFSTITDPLWEFRVEAAFANDPEERSQAGVGVDARTGDTCSSTSVKSTVAFRSRKSEYQIYVYTDGEQGSSETGDETHKVTIGHHEVDIISCKDSGQWRVWYRDFDETHLDLSFVPTYDDDPKKRKISVQPASGAEGLAAMPFRVAGGRIALSPVKCATERQPITVLGVMDGLTRLPWPTKDPRFYAAKKLFKYLIPDSPGPTYRCGALGSNMRLNFHFNDRGKVVLDNTSAKVERTQKLIGYSGQIDCGHDTCQKGWVTVMRLLDAEVA